MCQESLAAGEKVCAHCRADLAELRKSRAASGLCVKCGKPAEVGGKWTLCLVCWFKLKSVKYTGTVRNWQALRDKFVEQDGRCVYTGKVLTPGVDAAVDHRHPQARGGNGDLENLQWVCRRVNLMKNDCTHEEFIRFCRQVANRFPSIT